MKTNPLSFHFPTLALATLVLLGITATSLQAQTYAGRPALNAEPGSLEANIYPVINSARIKVIFAYYGSGFVRIQIRDEQGTVVFNQYEYKCRYKGQFDLAGLPAGAYRVSLQTDNAQYAQWIQIAPAVSSQISLISEQPGRTPIAEKLAVNQ